MSDSKPFAPAGTPARWVRPRPVLVERVELDCTIDLDRQRVEGTVVHLCVPQPHGQHRVLELDQHDLQIGSVTVDGATVPASQSAGRLAVPVPKSGERFRVAIAFAAQAPPKGLFFIPADPAHRRVAMAWTQGAIEDHSYWFPCLDDPNGLCTFRVAIRHRSAVQAIANGERISRTDHGDGWTTTVYEQAKPHVLYLLNVVVGDLVAVDDSRCSVPTTHWLPRGHEAGGFDLFRATGFAIDWLGRFIGVPYAWGRYGHVVVHGFTWGGMENTTLTTITDRVVMTAEDQQREDVDADSLVIHELVHQWFGDLLTMKGWSDIWLNESFATYLEARGTAAWRAAALGRNEADELALELWRNREAWLEEDHSRYRRALVTNRWADPEELFDRVSYEKGSLVLHHLCQVLGEPAFRAALKLYTTRHAHGLVETADWRQAIEDATGEPCDAFFDQWVHRAGHPVLKVTHRHDPARKQVIIEIEQTQAGGGDDKTFRLPTVVATSAGVHPVVLAKAKETLVIPMDIAPAWVAVDPAGELPVEWDESGDAAELVARLQARGGDHPCATAGRARAAVALGKKLVNPAIIAGLSGRLNDPGEADLVRGECAAALGELRDPAARAALIAALPGCTQPRIRRAVAAALAKPVRDPVEAAALAETLVSAADAESSRWVAGELLAARAALEHPGATPVLRARLVQASWQQRLRSAVVRGLGLSGEPAAADDAVHLIADVLQTDGVRSAAINAAATLGARHHLLRDRVRRAIEPHLESGSLQLRMAAAKALGTNKDPNARGALSARLDREPFGNVRRVIRESLESLGQAAAATTALAAAEKRIDELETARKKLELRLEVVEKRLGG